MQRADTDRRARHIDELVEVVAAALIDQPLGRELPHPLMEVACDQLPGYCYAGGEPNGFMWKGEVVEFFEGHAREFWRAGTVLEGVTVTELRRGLDSDWELLTADGRILHSTKVVVATGAYQRPHAPRLASDIDPFSTEPVQSLDDPAVRLGCLPMLTGTDTGEDMTPRTLRDEGIVIMGRLIAANGNRLFFADDLAATLAAGDAFVARIKARIDTYIEANALDAPISSCAAGVDDHYAAPRERDLGEAGVTSIVWATGYRIDFGWIFDAEFDEQGFPVHQAGITHAPGLYFVGLSWQTMRGLSFIPGAGPDAERIVAHIASRTGSTDPSCWRSGTVPV